MQERKGKTKRDLPHPPSLRPSGETPITMARPKNPRTIYPGSHHQPTNRYFYYHSVTLFLSHHPHSLSNSPLLSNSLLKTPRKPTLFSHHANILLLFLFLLLPTFSFLAFPEIPFLPTSPNSLVRRISSTLPLESTVVLLSAHNITGNLTQEEREFWEQPDGQGYQPCIEFSLAYRQASARITRERRRFVVAVVSGGLNQQRNQIVDVVVIARILGAALVVPVLKPNVVWGDQRLLRALGAPRSARVYWAGGEPLGGEQALRPLMTEFPQLMSKEMLASDGELVRFANRSSVLAALDFMVAMSSDVFMPSHGGNMARVMQVGA